MTTLQRWTLAAVCAATAVLMLDIAVVNTALSTIAVDLDTDLHGLQWVVDAYTLALATVVLSAGSLADRMGRRKLFIGGLALFTVSSVACAAAPTIEVLIGARAVQGIGAAVMFAVSLALLAQAFPGAQERAKALAAYGATIGASFAVGPLVGGALTTGLGWRWVFLINVPIGVACLAVAVTRVRESRDPRARKLDVPGQITLTGGLFLLVFALLRGNEEGWGSPMIVGLLAGAVVLLVAFVIVELQSLRPMVPMGLFRSPAFAGAQVAAFAISASFFAVFLYTTLYLQQVLGLTAVEAGLVYLPGTFLNFVAAGATAQLSNRVPRGALVAGGLVLVAIGMAMLSSVGTDSSWTAVLPGSMIAMLGTGMFNPAVSAVALDVPEHQSGLAAGINDTARQAGIAVGVAALGALIPASAGLGAADPAGFVAGLQDALLAGAGVAAVGALAAAVLIRAPRRAAATATA